MKFKNESINFKCPTNYNEAVEYIRKMKYCMDNPDTIDIEWYTNTRTLGALVIILNEKGILDA